MKTPNNFFPKELFIIIKANFLEFSAAKTFSPEFEIDQYINIYSDLFVE